MKPHLVIVCGILYPQPSPTGLCALRYASLLKEEYGIEFVALTSNGKSEDAFIDGFRVHTLTSRRLALEHRAKGAVRKIIHRIGSVQLKLFLTGNMGWYRWAVGEKLEQLHTEKPVDALFTVCSPFTAHQAGMDFKQKHKEVRFCAYTVDPFAAPTRIIPFGKRYEDLIRLESSVCETTDCLFLSEEALSSRQDVYGNVPNVMALPYLLPDAIAGREDYFANDAVNCVYAGSFYKELRNPEYMLKVFSALKNKNIVLHLFSSGCDDIVRHYVQKSDNIVMHGYVSQEELRDVYSSCDFLIGVGNASKEFLPSKTYEYISLRRPIVFFNPKGFHNDVLGKYKYSLQLSDDKAIEEAVACLEGFVDNNRISDITDEELQEIYKYNTPTHIRSLLLKGISNN